MSAEQKGSASSVATGRANYGIDAPDVLRNFFLIGLAGIALWFFSEFAANSSSLTWLRAIGLSGLIFGLTFFAQALVMLWGSKTGKLKLRDRVIDDLELTGDETVLDVGCGHGLMLIAAAKQLRSGKAIGIDLWQQEDQAGNSGAATMHNAELEGVANRIDLRDADARKLPFADNTFDIVLSSWALHNIYDPAGRAIALREIVRVLKPSGRVVIVDIRHTAEYAQVLKAAGLATVKRSAPNFLFVIPSHRVTAMKI